MKQDTKWRLRDTEGKEYIIIDSEKVDMQEELNKMITKQMKEIERLHSIIKEVKNFINNNSYESGDTSSMYLIDTDKLLEILEKEKNNGNKKR